MAKTIIKVNDDNVAVITEAVTSELKTIIGRDRMILDKASYEQKLVDIEEMLAVLDAP